MAHDDAGSGLRSWISRALRRRSAATLGAAAADDRWGGYDKQALKEAIERKRHNDLVRQREFDHLRQLRRRGLTEDASQAEVQPSLFESSLPVPSDERATTLRKIDEIEAQMSRQWWRGTAPDDPPPASLSDTTLQAQAGDSQFAPTQAAPLPPGDGRGWQQPVPPDRPPPPRVTAPPATQRRADPATLADAGGAVAVLDRVLTDPDLEEAALRFANGDLSGAEAGLLEALRGAPSGKSERACLWLAGLREVYRAMGQSAGWERTLAEFGDHCAQPVWSCPAQLSAQALHQLERVLQEASAPWWLDWRALVSLEAGALEALERLFGRWCETPLRMRWRGHERLTQVLRALTVPNDRQAGHLPWQVRMQVLRIARQHDEFDLVALEYCATFALPPPTWEEALCECALDDVATEPGWQHDAIVELAGDWVGDVGAMLTTLAAEHQDAAGLVLSCARLGRVDFAAAGSLLTWVQMQRARGCAVQFREVNPLVATFFHVIGLDEQARIALCPL